MFTKVCKHVRCRNWRSYNVRREENPQKENEMKSPSFEDFHDDNPSIAWPFCLRVLLASQHGRKCCYFPGQWRQKTKLFFEFSTTLSNRNKCRHVAYMLQITYVVCRMQLLNLLHVPWKRNALLVFSGKVRGESLSSLDVELWKKNTDFRYISLLCKKVTVCEFLFIACVRAWERVWVTLGVRGYSCFVRVYVCTCVPGYDVKSKKIEMNWSEKINDQQNLNNAT